MIVLNTAGALALCGCAGPPHGGGPVRHGARLQPPGTGGSTYGFVHRETTGITSYVVVQGGERAIRFSADSDGGAVRSFRALTGRVMLPNADGRSIFLTGELSAETMRTPSCEGCPTPEEYREFRLQDWYIVTPFRAVREDCGDCSYLMPENLRDRTGLERSDFEPFEGREALDLGRFQRSGSAR